MGTATGTVKAMSMVTAMPIAAVKRERRSHS